MRHVDCSTDEERRRGIELAAGAARRHQLVVFPTDTVYAVACDAFSAIGVERLNEAKGRLSDAGLPVMVGSIRAAKALIRGLTVETEELIQGFWPGQLTVVCRVQGTLNWDLGGDGQTVTVRMPVHPVALALLQEVGPMAVVAANVGGSPPPLDCAAAQEQLQESVSVYLDAGPCQPAEPSTVVDLTGEPPRVLRSGALAGSLLRTVVPDLVLGEEQGSVEEQGPAEEQGKGEPPSDQERPAP